MLLPRGQAAISVLLLLLVVFGCDVYPIEYQKPGGCLLFLTLENVAVDLGV